ncbi:MAG: hypothetical protein KBT06_10495, partial [Prevotellaceae bacterium]|nr:hypothetical protein [Candidatus Colivivens equi]
KYIQAWKNNFDTYTKLKAELKLDGNIETIGEVGMKVSIGGYLDGVCIDGWHMRVNTREEIEEIIRDYKMAKNKATKIQEMLRAL